MCKVENPSVESSSLNTNYKSEHSNKLTNNDRLYLSQAGADPRSNLGHRDAASLYFLSTIR